MKGFPDHVQPRANAPVSGKRAKDALPDWELRVLYMSGEGFMDLQLQSLQLWNKLRKIAVGTRLIHGLSASCDFFD